MTENFQDVRSQIHSMAIDIDLLKKSHVDLNLSYVSTLKSLSEMTSHAADAAQKAAKAAESAAIASRGCA